MFGAMQKGIGTSWSYGYGVMNKERTGSWSFRSY